MRRREFRERTVCLGICGKGRVRVPELIDDVSVKRLVQIFVMRRVPLIVRCDHKNEIVLRVAHRNLRPHTEECKAALRCPPDLIPVAVGIVIPKAVIVV